MDKSMWNEHCPLCNWGFYVDEEINKLKIKIECVKCGSIWLSKKK